MFQSWHLSERSCLTSLSPCPSWFFQKSFQILYKDDEAGNWFLDPCVGSRVSWRYFNRFLYFLPCQKSLLSFSLGLTKFSLIRGNLTSGCLKYFCFSPSEKTKTIMSTVVFFWGSWSSLSCLHTFSLCSFQLCISSWTCSDFLWNHFSLPVLLTELLKAAWS